MAQVEWVEVRDGTQAIGAVGFIGNEAVIIASYFEGADANRDGHVSVSEWLVSKNPFFGLERYNLTLVAQTAKYQESILMRDANFVNWANQMYLNFASQLVRDGIYATYFRMPVARGAGALASMLTRSKVKEFLIKKGVEAAVEKAFKEAVGG